MMAQYGDMKGEVKESDGVKAPSDMLAAAAAAAAAVAVVVALV